MRSLLAAVVPVAAVLLFVALVFATGFSERSFFGTALEDRFYGFFFRAYPLFLFAAAYGAARILAAAASEPGARKTLRTFSTPLALLLFLAACFHPTFGGLVLRPGYMAGGISFLRGQSATVAVVLGAGAAAFAFGTILGVCGLLARLSLGFRWRRIGRVLVRFLALWLGAVVLIAPGRLGIDPVGSWPMGPLAGSFALKTAAIAVLAFLPHAIAVAWGGPAWGLEGTSARRCR
jgi:hypothetical protein